MINPLNVVYFAPHLVQYHTGLYAEIAKEKRIDFKVVYLDNIGLKPVFVSEFNKTINWDVDLLSGYEAQFLKNYSRNPMGGFFARVNFGIVGVFVKNKPDVVIFQGYTRFSDWLILAAAKLTNTKIVFRGEANLRKRNMPLKLRDRCKKIFLVIWLKLCHVVMYSCTGNREYWKHYGVDEAKMFPIPCSVDNNFFRQQHKVLSPRKGSIKNDLDIGNDNLIVLFSARFTQRKRPLDLLKAIARIDHSKITVLFVGDGPERSVMEKFVVDNNISAIFTGFVNQSEISKYYSIADINIIISDYDPSPKAMNESMNFRLPVIVTDVIGTAYDLVKDGENGFVVNVGNIELISEKIEFFNKNRDLVIKMGDKSFDRVEGWNFQEDVKGLMEGINSIVRE
jgi:glycosyltransferase involved in cell wall biosynthesis